ncbi:MAG: hypothetical protein OXG08_11145 [Gammaproteobacteria bacterium]|nr:hypothetical protein [Gammaproteobacteria bacterium]
MNDKSNQFSAELPDMNELSPDPRVWQRISESIQQRKRRTTQVRTLAAALCVVLSTCGGLGYFLTFHGADGGHYSNDEPYLLTQDVESSDLLVGTDTYSNLSWLLAAVFDENALANDDLETLFECITQARADYLADASDLRSHVNDGNADAREIDSPGGHSLDEAHSQCLKNLLSVRQSAVRMKARTPFTKVAPNPI